MTAARRGTAALAVGESDLDKKLRPNQSRWEDLKYGRRKRHISRISALRLQLVVSTLWLACYVLFQTVDGFSVSGRTSMVVTGKSNNVMGTSKIWAAGDDNPSNEEYAARSGSLEESFEDFGEDDLQSAGVVIDDLNWRVEKMRLEEANRRRFLKSKPRFLPYDECRKWVQAFGIWETEEDWRDWIAMGEKRNSYIPSRPDEYYGDLGQWISWEHFLCIPPSDESEKK